VEDFSSTGQLVTLGLVDSSIGAMAKGLALVDVEAFVAKDSKAIGHERRSYIILLLWSFHSYMYSCLVNLIMTISVYVNHDSYYYDVNCCNHLL
jgi:hypothetical protein